MQSENKRACAACGAANTIDATACWQCLARFGDNVAAAGGSLPTQTGPVGGQPRYPLPSPMPAPPAAPARAASTGVRVLVGVLAAIAGYVGVQYLLGGSDVTIPDTVAGVPRMHDAMAAEFEEDLLDEAARYDMQAEAAVFGSVGVPDFLLIVVEGSTDETTDEMFDSFVQGMSEGGATVDSLRRTGELAGASYRCVGAEAAGTGVGVCMWRTDDHVGIVLDLMSDTRTAEALTSAVYGDVAG